MEKQYLTGGDVDQRFAKRITNPFGGDMSHANTQPVGLPQGPIQNYYFLHRRARFANSLLCHNHVFHEFNAGREPETLYAGVNRTVTDMIRGHSNKVFL